MVKLKEYTLIGLVGGMGYGIIEVLWRGFTHWSMVLTGGICLCIIYMLSRLDKNYILLCFTSALVISVLEFSAGVIFNIALKMQIWDYSTEKYNLLGQICPKYCLYWFVLCLAAIPLCRYFKRFLNYLLSGTMG